MSFRSRFLTIAERIVKRLERWVAAPPIVEALASQPTPHIVEVPVSVKGWWNTPEECLDCKVPLDAARQATNGKGYPTCLECAARRKAMAPATEKAPRKARKKRVVEPFKTEGAAPLAGEEPTR